MIQGRDESFFGGGAMCLNAAGRVSVDPGDGDPLGGGGHQVYGLLQHAEGVVDLVVDDGLVEVVGVGVLQHLGFFLEPLEGVVLRSGTREEVRRSRAHAESRRGGLFCTIGKNVYNIQTRAELRAVKVLTGSFLHHFGILSANESRHAKENTNMLKAKTRAVRETEMKGDLFESSTGVGERRAKWERRRVRPYLGQAGGDGGSRDEDDIRGELGCPEDL